MKWIAWILLCSTAWLYYERGLFIEQNENLTTLNEALKDEIRVKNTVKPAPICVPKIIELPCEIIYTSDSCDPCRCDNQAD